MSKEPISQAIAQGITFLAREQSPDGCFLSRSSPHQDNFIQAPELHTTFSTSIILSTLNELPNSPQLKIIKHKATRFLLQQKSTRWSFNYWDRKSKEATTMPYPDDMDDTFCALTALFQSEKKIISGEALAHIVKLLTTLEKKTGGPYRTWLVDLSSKKNWLDVDLAVNSNIAYFLFLNNIHLSGLTKYIESEIIKEKFKSPYYPSFYPIIYFISRFYKGKYASKIRQFLLLKKEKNETWGNSLHTALAISSLLNLNYPPENLKPSILSLVKEQKHGQWKAYGFCFDPSKNTIQYFSGSDALTTALCIQALNKYMQSTMEIETTYEKKRTLHKQERIYTTIIKQTENRLSLFDSHLQKQAHTLITRLTKNNKDKQIPLLPFYFAQSLNIKKEIPETLLIQLGVANLFGWIAYTIYDNFLDGETEPQSLPLANIALREVTKLFQNVLPKNKEWQTFFHSIMDNIDDANLWEVLHCRIKLNNGVFIMKELRIPKYGSYKKLAEKSLGHGLGPLAILFFLGYKKHTLEVQNLVHFFKHYLIARQLHDDAHDWKNDLAMGQINPVCAMILSELSLKKRKTFSTKTSLPTAQKIFLENTLEKTSRTILRHTSKAKQILKQYSLLHDRSFFENLVVQYERGAKTAIEEKKRAMQFMLTYNNG